MGELGYIGNRRKFRRKKVLNTILTKSKAEKYLKGKVIKKVIFVKNRVINYILSE